MSTMEKRSKTGRSKRLNRASLVAIQIGILALLLLLWQVSVSTQNLMFFSRPTLVGSASI